MARIRQQYPNNYRTSGNISTEFENLYRYLNAAEFGSKTVGELLDQLFDADGVWEGPIAIRLDSTNGLQYRVGTYADPSAGWLDIADIADIRGPSGQSLGLIEGPLFYNRQDIVATSSQTDFPYTFDDDIDTVLVYQNGLLLAEADYTADDVNNEIVLDTGATVSDVITIYSVRDQAVQNYRRSDVDITTNGTVNVSFVHTDDETLIVYRNGILQREGGGNDYTTNATLDIVAFTSGLTSGDVISIITAENEALSIVGGLMTESVYTNGSGQIPYSVLSVADGAIPAAKVADVADLVSDGSFVFVSGTAPSPASTRKFWIDTSTSPNVLKFYDGSTWISTNPVSSLPDFGSSDANFYLRVNGTGTALLWDQLDLTSVVPKTYIGAANGVAELDSSGVVPVAQLPTIVSYDTLPFTIASTVSNGTYLIRRLFRQTIRIYGITHVLSTGTCTLQLSVDGTPIGTTYGSSSTAADDTFGAAIEVDATSASKRLELVVTSASSSADLELGVAVEQLA